MLTLDHYREVFASSEFWRGFGNTMLLGFVGATLTMLLGGNGRLCLGSHEMARKVLIDAMAWLPWMMPGIVLGVGFLWGFALLPHAIPIYGTIWALLLAYISLGTPLSVRAMSSAYASSRSISRSVRVCMAPDGCKRCGGL